MRMPTFRTRRSAAKGEEGFTLIELLAVMAILAIAITAFTFGGTGGIETARFRGFLAKASAELRQGRATALRSMTEKVVYIDVERRRIGDPQGGEFVDIPDGVQLKAIVAESETYEDGTVGIRFYPAGNSSGGTLTFIFHEQAYELRVNWLTGDVVTYRG
jgi:general secretion pathway protein H